MKHISIIVPAGNAVLSSVVGSFKIFSAVNQFFLSQGKREIFEIDLVGIQPQTTLYNGLFTVNPNKSIEDIKRTDLIIVTTIIGDFEEEIKKNEKFIDWIKTQRLKNGAEVASLCTGAFLLAATGLMDGKKCTTHWMAHDAFQFMFPKVDLVPSKIICEDNGIYSSGGAYSFLNLLLYLVEKYSGREVAIWCSKLFEIEFDRTDQGQFTIFNGQKDHADKDIQIIQEYIEQNYTKGMSLDELASEFALSKRNFIRRFKKATANTPFEYLQRVRIEAAKKSFESSSSNVSEVMHAVGYNDDKAFRNVFRKYTGLSPMEYRLKYNPENVSVA